MAEQLVKHIDGRLLDNHAIFNLAFSLYEFRTPPFYETVRAVRDIAFLRVTTLPVDVPVTLTSAYADTEFGRENWAAIREMANKRGSPLCIVVLDCSLAENLRRLQTPQRALLRKLVDPAPLIAAREAHDLLESGGDHVLRFDTSDLRPEESANRILEWLNKENLFRGPLQR